jgi:hypothetical protein
MTLFGRASIGGIPCAILPCVRKPASIRRRFGFLIPWLLCRMVDVEYLHRIFGNAVKDLVGIATERHHANARAAGRTAGTCGPARDERNDAPYAPLDHRCNRRVVND